MNPNVNPVVAVVMLVLGIVFLVFPETVQRTERLFRKDMALGKVKFLNTFLESKSYVWWVRGLGLLWISIVLFLLFGPR
jgi:hypothetical protein